MPKNHMLAKMPEFVIFAKALVLGIASAEIFRISYLGGTRLLSYTEMLDPILVLMSAAIIFALLVWYAILRGIVGNIGRLILSWRIDLFLCILGGIWASELLLPVTKKFHTYISESNKLWTLLVGSFLLIMILSSLAQALMGQRKKRLDQIHFLDDSEILDPAEDVLGNNEQATQFAKTVLESSSNSALVYGLDAPWGFGKTSFINLAVNYWQQNAGREVIIFRFEPLRYASEPDLPEKFIRDLSAEIQRQVFVPEFPATVTRYSRLLKGKTDFSFLGFKFTFEPSSETIDELLEDINDVLKHISRRLIIVIDDLDRLDVNAVNSVLFMLRRTFSLSQTAYILCYDTEILVANNDDAVRARQFLEKFINLKISLFVDTSALVRFVRTDWKVEENKFQSIPSDTMLKLASVLSELGDMLEDSHAATYMSLIGDMRKLKRFVNALLMIQIEKTDLSNTDFNQRDLINLMLLHLHFPGIFRKIYLEESEGRSGIFSIKINEDGTDHKFVNTEEYVKFSDSSGVLEKFLLDQLFSTKILEFGDFENVDEAVQASRACFNIDPFRNLEKYLKLIVRFSAPEPRATFRLYQDAVSKVLQGNTIESVLDNDNFDLKHGERAHDQFWRILVSQSIEFKSEAANDSINTLIKFLPKYSLVDVDGRGLRTRSIYNLNRLVDRAGWGRTDGKRLPNSSVNIIEIAHLIFGEEKYSGNGLIDRLSAIDRGALGWFDLTLFRLQCSADRQGQLHNLQNALILYDNINAPTSGLVANLAIIGMRTISQRIFTLFKSRYIDNNKNLFDDLDSISDAQLLGDAASFYFSEAMVQKTDDYLSYLIKGARSMTKSFIVYQLANRQPPSGSGVGTGYYNLLGSKDDGEIAEIMNDYIFNVCFNPDIKEQNVEHFLDYCLSNLTSGIWEDGNERKYQPSRQSLVSGLSADKLRSYWAKHKSFIMARNFTSSDKEVLTLNYIASYAQDLEAVFNVLDQI
jgi:hypothetical protein